MVIRTLGSFASMNLGDYFLINILLTVANVYTCITTILVHYSLVKYGFTDSVVVLVYYLLDINFLVHCSLVK